VVVSRALRLTPAGGAELRKEVVNQQKMAEVIPAVNVGNQLVDSSDTKPTSHKKQLRDPEPPSLCAYRPVSLFWHPTDLVLYTFVVPG
jgi:hypothetical protein